MPVAKNAMVPLLLALAVARAPAQETTPDPSEALKELLSKALTISISARVLPADTETDAPIWNAESTRLTIPGRSIRVRLDGDNVRIYLVCTPYLQENGEVLLLAQGQIWFSEPADKESRYTGTYYAIPMSLGTPIFFYPLGVSGTSDQQKDHYDIEVEITIVPYEASASAAPAPAAGSKQ